MNEIVKLFRAYVASATISVFFMGILAGMIVTMEGDEIWVEPIWILPAVGAIIMAGIAEFYAWKIKCARKLEKKEAGQND